MANRMRSQVFGSLSNVVAVWFSCPLRMLLQFIAGAFFKWMSNIVFEPSSTEKTLGRESLCDLFSFEYGHGWVLDLSSRQLKPWYKLCYVRAKGLMCFISCEGVTLCLCASFILATLSEEVLLEAVNLTTNQLSFHQSENSSGIWVFEGHV